MAAPPTSTGITETSGRSSAICTSSSTKSRPSRLAFSSASDHPGPITSTSARLAPTALRISFSHGTPGSSPTTSMNTASGPKWSRIAR